MQWSITVEFDRTNPGFHISGGSPFTVAEWVSKGNPGRVVVASCCYGIRRWYRDGLVIKDNTISPFIIESDAHQHAWDTGCCLSE